MGRGDFSLAAPHFHPCHVDGILMRVCLHNPGITLQRSSTTRLSGILLLCGLLVAGVARGSIPEIQVAPEVTVVRAEFGLLGAPKSDEPAFTPSAVVPYRENQGYGWIILLKTNKSRIKWREEFTLPASPKTWGEGEKQGLRSISPDRKYSVTEREVTPDDGLIYNSWAVAPGDPRGRYLIRVIIEGIKEVSFEFEVQ
jgi:hypothetical protein